jgi:hypothetical protein
MPSSVRLKLALPHRQSHARTAAAPAMALLALILSAGHAGRAEWHRYFAVGLPQTASVNVWHVLFYSPQIEVTLGGHGVGAPWRASLDEVRNSPALWVRMHLADWNTVPSPTRELGLNAMLRRYRPVLMTPGTWDRMTPFDWDAVPQPVRTLAYRQMLAYWSGFYHVGSAYGLPRRVVTDTLAAIVMSESWFDHRAGVAYDDGTRDVGLGQASDYARNRLRQLHALGRVDASFADPDYANPWAATRFVALWMSLMLDETHGDLDLAVRAYNRGIDRAHDSLGTKYADTVRSRLARYIRNHDAPVAWRYLWDRARELEQEQWPWTAPSTPVPGGDSRRN